MPIVSRPQEIKFYLYIATAFVFINGAWDLVHGGVTLSALLLAIGYCILVPASIWFARRNEFDDLPAGDAPPYRAAALVALGVFGVYVLTMAPSTAMWDTSEYIAAAYTFGLPHPPGNPFFIIIGRAFAVLPIAGNVAKRINVLAALSSAAAAGMWFLIAEHVMRGWLRARWTRLVGATLAALIGATAFTVWNQSVVNEKVYTVSLAGIAIVSWLAIRWSARPNGARADAYLALMAYLCALGYANHMAGMLPGPAIALMVLVRRPATLVRWRPLVACAGALIVGFSPFATQPIRAAFHPAINEGEPTACRGTLEVSCTFSKGTLAAFKFNFNRGQYGKPDLAERQATFGQQLGMWWMYFKWQWLRDPNSSLATLQAILAAVFFVLGIAGAWVHFTRDRTTFWYFGTLMFTITLLLIFYLNFKLGFSQDQTLQAPHEVRDRDYFFLWSFSAWGVWAGLGLVSMWEALASVIGAQDVRDGKFTIAEPTTRGWASAAPILALAVVPLTVNGPSASRAKHTATQAMAEDMLNSVEPYGVLITVGDNDTFPLWYAQEVEGVRRDVTVAVTSLLNTDWYARGIIRRPIYEYDAEKGPAVYRGKTWPKPTHPALQMTFGEVDSVPEYYQMSKPTQFTIGPFQPVVDARQLEYGVFQRADALVMRMVQDNWSERPIYFARTAGGYPHALGFGDDILTQGLVSKVILPPKVSTTDTVLVQGDGWFDVARTRALWNDVFNGPRAVIREGQWVDRASVGMAAMYMIDGAEFAQVLNATGRAGEANGVMATANEIARAAHLENAIPGLDQAFTPAPPAKNP